MEKCQIDCSEIRELKIKFAYAERNMVMKSTVRWIIGTSVVVLLSFGGTVWNSSVKARDERVDNKSNIKVFNVKIDNLIQRNEEQNKKIDKYIETSEKNSKEIQDLLNKVIRNDRRRNSSGD